MALARKGSTAGRMTRGWPLALAFVLLVAACGDDGGDDAPVALGPGTDETPPAEAIVDEEPGTEPDWLTRVPAVVAPEATEDGVAETAKLSATSPLAGSATEVDAAAFRSEGIHGDYAGRMQIEIAYFDYCQTGDGNLGFAGSRTYDMAVEVYVNPPAEHEGISERSPFNLIVGSETGVEGSLLLMSAQVATDPTDGRSLVVDYWDIDQSGDQFSGVLTDRWPGLVFNYIETSQLLVPCQPQLGTIALPDAIAEGAELTGRFTDDGLELEVLAQTYDREVRFSAVIDVERT